MHAKSLVYTQTQKPGTLLGLLPELFALVIMFAFTAATIAIVLGSVAGAILLGILTLTGSHLALLRWQKDDIHKVSVIMAASRFWKNKKTRIFCSGLSPKKRSKKK